MIHKLQKFSGVRGLDSNETSTVVLGSTTELAIRQLSRSGTILNDGLAIRPPLSSKLNENGKRAPTWMPDKL